MMGRVEPSLRILLAEDDSEMRSLLSAKLQAAGYAVHAVANGTQLLACIGRDGDVSAGTAWDLIVTDQRMPGLTGLEALERIRELGCVTPVILITAFGDRAMHEEARRRGAMAVLDKPFDVDDLCRMVRSIQLEAVANR